MIKFIIEENNDYYKVGNYTNGYFINALDCDTLRGFINIRQYFNIDYDSFGESLRSYGGSHQSTKSLDDAWIITVLYFKSKENAKLFIKEYLEPQLVASQLLK